MKRSLDDNGPGIDMNAPAAAGRSRLVAAGGRLLPVVVGTDGAAV